MPLWNLSDRFYFFQKRCVVKAIRYENRAELFVFNGNKRPIRYEFQNGVKANRYNGNIVLDLLDFYWINLYEGGCSTVLHCIVLWQASYNFCKIKFSYFIF